MFPRTSVGNENQNWTWIDLTKRRELAIYFSTPPQGPQKIFILGLMFSDAHLWEWESARMKGRIVIGLPGGASWR